MSELHISLQSLIQESQEEGKIIQECIRMGNTHTVLQYSFRLSRPLKANIDATEYYELFLSVFDGLVYVENFFLQKPQEKTLYDRAQYFPEILPRLYITITAGVALYKQTQDAFYMDDMLELVKTIQHPLRGLFLRYYLNKKLKDQLKENCKDSIRFVLNNLSAMNSLWSRIDSVQERQKLKLTVGENIERLSVLCSEKKMYLEEIFPFCMETIRDSDLVSQQYLLDGIVQAFPDEFQLDTLDEFLKISCEIQRKKDIIDLVMCSLQRLKGYLGEVGQTVENTTFLLMQEFLMLASTENCKENIEKKVELCYVIMQFANGTDGRIEHFFRCLDTCVSLLDTTENPEISVILGDILSFSLGSCLCRLMTSQSFYQIYFFINESEQLRVTHAIVKAIDLEAGPLEDEVFWTNTFKYLKVLTKNATFAEKLLIIRILHKVNPPNLYIPSQEFIHDELISTAIAFLCMKSMQVFPDLHELFLEIIKKVQNLPLSIHLSITAAISINKSKLSFVLPQLFEIIFSAYEKIVENSIKINTLPCIIGCICALENCEAPLEKITQLCYKIPKKFDQCTILLSLIHVFSSNTSQDSEKVLENLKRCVKLADLCATGTKHLSLFVSILNTYIYFYTKPVPSIESSSIESIIELIFELLSFQYDKDANYAQAKTYLLNTIRWIEIKQLENKLTEVSFNAKVFLKM